MAYNKKKIYQQAEKEQEKTYNDLIKQGYTVER